MTKRLLAFLMVLLLLCPVALADDSQPTAEAYPVMPADDPVILGGSKFDYARSVIATEDALYVSGSTTSGDGDFAGDNPTGNTLAYLLRLDASGQIVWKYVYELQKGYNDFGFMQPMADGTLLNDFLWYGDNVNQYNAIFQWNADGSVLRQFELDTGNGDLDVRANGDGYFLIDINQGGPRIFHCYDAQGNLKWTREYPELANCGYWLARVSDGYLLVGQKTQPAQEGPVNHMICKLSPDGELLWQTLSGESDFGGFQRAAVLPDGGVVAVGEWYLNSEDGGMLHAVRGYIARYDAQGALLWEKTTDLPYKAGFDAVVAIDGGYLVAGEAGTDANADDPSSKRLLHYWLYGEDGELKGTWVGATEDSYDYPYLVSGFGNVYLVCTLRDKDWTAGVGDICVQRLRVDELK